MVEPAFAGRLLVVALAAISLEACSDDSDQSSAREPPGRGASLARSDTAPWRQGIFIQGVPLETARANRWFDHQEYDLAARKFPTIEACVAHDDAKAAGLTIDWTRVGSDVEAAVCLSRVASTIGSVNEIVAWMKAQGFAVTAVREAGEFDTYRAAPQKSGTVIEAQWSLKKNGPLYREGLAAPLAQRALGHGVSVGIFISQTGDVVSVKCSTIIL
jgi:hypothetical protein